MKENKYEDELFFEKYRRFPRSVDGLKSAGEWHEFQKMLPDFDGKRVLDLGCGFSWHCTYAAEQGAASVVGSGLISINCSSNARKRPFALLPAANACRATESTTAICW